MVVRGSERGRMMATYSEKEREGVRNSKNEREGPPDSEREQEDQWMARDSKKTREEARGAV